MSLPLATHEITVTRVVTKVDIDGYEDNQPNAITVFENIPAVLSPPSSSTRLVGGNRVVNNGQLRCDPIDIHPQDIVNDGRGTNWIVLDVSQIAAVGLTFTQCSIRLVSGAT